MLAAAGDASVLSEVGETTEPGGGCPQPNYSVTVAPSVTGDQLAADEAAYAQTKGLFTDPCGGFVYTFHNTSEVSGGGYTAGAVLVSDGAIQIFTGPVGSGAAYTFGH